MNNNNENKLTAQELARIFAMYWGAKVLLLDKKTPFTVISMETQGLAIKNGVSQYPASYNECKLILKPLSKISDEDAIEVAKIVNFEDEIEREDIYAMLCHVFSVNDGSEYELLTVEVFVKLINYLRSKSYDCDNLISQGIAIEHS